MRSDSKWLFITVGAGSRDIEEAADRIHNQALQFGLFDSVVSIKTDSLIKLFPNLELEGARETKGFGYYRWKSGIVSLALSGYWGNFDGVCFADAGCEVNFNLASYFSLKRTLLSAERDGVVAYAISTPERNFTKRLVLEHFNAVEDYTNQFQSGSIFLHGAIGLEIARKWESLSSSSVSFSDESLSMDGEFPDFFQHRHDQSLLSLILKQAGIVPSPKHPPGLPVPHRLNLRNIASPLWWARNRTGVSKRRKIDVFLAYLSMVILKGSSLFRTFRVLLSGSFLYIRLGGGLGNQLHQFSAAKALSTHLDKKLLIDIEGIAKSDHGVSSNASDFQLNSICINSRFFSILFRFWRKLYNRLHSFIEFKSVYIASSSGYTPDLMKLPFRTSYLEGFFHTYQFAWQISNVANSSDLILRNQGSDWFQESLAETLHKNICAIHLRRGDYLKTWMHYGVLSQNYYENALAYIPSKNVDEYWLFSDSEIDISEWSFIDKSKTKLMTPPKDSTAAESIVLMSRGRWLVTANSTFSWWGGALFSPREKSVIAPMPFFRTGEEFPLLYPPDWQICPSKWLDF